MDRNRIEKHGGLWHSAVALQPCSSGRAHVPEDKKEKNHLNTHQIQINQKFLLRFKMAKRLILTFSINYKGRDEIRSIEKRRVHSGSI